MHTISCNEFEYDKEATHVKSKKTKNPVMGLMFVDKCSDFQGVSHAGVNRMGIMKMLNNK